MTKNISEEELLLRKRARRRLLGAIVLVVAAVIVLPMVFDQPKQSHQQAAIDVRIPGAEEVPMGDTVPPIEILPEADPDEIVGFTEHVPDKPNVLSEGQTFIEPSGTARSEYAGDTEMDGMPEIISDGSLGSIPIPRIKPNSPVSKEVTREAVQNKTVATVVSSEKRSGLGQEVFIIQLGAFSDRLKAKQQQQNLVSHGINAYTEMRTIDNNEITRVRVGPFSTRLAAEQELNKLMKLGLSGVVTTQ